MTTAEFFTAFWEKVKGTPHWITMMGTVENSPWHREANVAVHTTMTIHQYMTRFYEHRTERQQMLSLMALLFHDFGKPEAEETLEKKDEPGVFYRRYAGHEPISGNEFMSFMCDYHELREMFFAQGYDWNDIRTIKVMIEHHLPYGLKNEHKRKNLRQMIQTTLGHNETCFYDMLRSDAAGRISDDHEQKLQNVEDWIEEFQTVTWKPHDTMPDAPTLILMVGISGAGKSTLIKKMIQEADDQDFIVFSEDALRLEYAAGFMDRTDMLEMNTMTEAEQYQACWNFCHLSKDSKFDQYSKLKWREALATGSNIVLDRMNQGRKARNTFIQPAREKGYIVRSIEFFMSETKANERQRGRVDKTLPPRRVHQIMMQMETPWYGPEVDTYQIVPVI